MRTRRHLALRAAELLAVGAVACSQPTPSPTPPASPAVSPVSPSDRAAVATRLEGRWVTKVVAGDAVTVTTELELARGAATEVERTSSMAGPSTVRTIAAGHYGVTESGELALSLASKEGERRLQSTVTFVRGWPGAEAARGAAPEFLLPTSYVPRAPGGRAFRYDDATWTPGAQPPGVRRVVVDVEFTTPLPTIVATRARCTVDVSVYAQAATAAFTQRRAMPCHAAKATAEGLLEIVIDESATTELPFVTEVRKREGRSELAELVERGVDRSFFVDPKQPDQLLRAYVGVSGQRAAWWRVPE